MLAAKSGDPLRIDTAHEPATALPDAAAETNLFILNGYSSARQPACAKKEGGIRSRPRQTLRKSDYGATAKPEIERVNLWTKVPV
jgi:hypothetical protein